MRQMSKAIEKTELYSSKFACYVYYPSSQALFSDWYKATRDMTSITFREEMVAWVRVIEKCKPKYIYDRCLDFEYSITHDERLWAAHLINPAMVHSGVIRYAHLQPLSLFAERPVELLFEEFLNMQLPNQYPIKHFVSTEMALAWLFQEENMQGGRHF